MSRVLTCALLALGCAAGGLMAAEPKDVPDPTRPAPAFRAKRAAAASPAPAAASAASAVATGGDRGKPSAAAGLSAIRVDVATGRAVALIGDELLTVGERYKGATVVAITPYQVTLQDPRGLRKLQLDNGLIAAPSEGSPRKPARHPSRRKETP